MAARLTLPMHKIFRSFYVKRCSDNTPNKRWIKADFRRRTRNSRGVISEVSSNGWFDDKGGKQKSGSEILLIIRHIKGSRLHYAGTTAEHYALKSVNKGFTKWRLMNAAIEMTFFHDPRLMKDRLDSMELILKFDWVPEY